ncbi:IclR family transcriptional regulator [Paenibacillus thalictri]|uniref:IclR family transcriptional regulator n=1 Tax=Paenibacillus thalictri TaxID=2527873 RepID=A0A4Q9DJU4_9BACL|nr:IclR family transcriptional regulator [Paenibacillus thalictri]TBL73311.1 IclR family transcriptional regulator [Paenibacillus thalictri]
MDKGRGILRDLNINYIQSVDRAIDILNAFSAEKPALTIDEVMKITELTRATAYRLLYTMERRGLIRYDTAAYQYRLGLKMLDYGYQLTSSLDIVKEAEDILTGLHVKTQQTVLMVLIEDEQLVYVFKKEKEEGLKYSSSVGQRRSLFYGVLGRVALAYLPEERIAKLLSGPIPKETPHTVTDKQQMLEQLAEIRRTGICVEVNETTLGVTAIGAPIYDAKKNVVAATGIICPSIQLSEDQLQQFKEMLRKAAADISGRLGYISAG